MVTPHNIFHLKKTYRKVILSLPIHLYYVGKFCYLVSLIFMVSNLFAFLLLSLIFCLHTTIFFYSRAIVLEVRSIREILHSYEHVSGKIINLDKSMLTCSRNIPNQQFDELKQLLNVNAIERYDKYQRLSTMNGKSKTQFSILLRRGC